MTTKRTVRAMGAILVWRARTAKSNYLEIFTPQEKGHYKHRTPGIWLSLDPASCREREEAVAKALAAQDLKKSSTWQEFATAALSALGPKGK